MSKYLCIYPSGEVSWVDIVDTEDRIRPMHQIIGCSCVEQVQTIFPNICIVIDESGKIKFPAQEHNEIASRLYAGWLHGMDDIVGPAIVCALRPVPPFMELDWFPLNQVELAHLSLYLGIAIPDIN